MALDFDSGRTTEADIRQHLDGYAYLAYTSYSHQPELEKWRVFVPYHQPISKEQHAAVFRHFQARFGGDVATSTIFSHRRAVRRTSSRRESIRLTDDILSRR